MKQINFYSASEIIYFHSIENYTEANLANGKKELSSYTLNRYQEKHETFLRVNKYHLPNPNFIAKTDAIGSVKEVKMGSGKRVKVSRNKKEVLKHIL